MEIKSQDFKISVVGLGYVGLPLAVLFAKKFKTFGFDVNRTRVSELLKGNDETKELESRPILNAINSGNLSFSYNQEEITNSNIYVVCVPTPVDINNSPDFTPLINASKLIGKILNKSDIVIYESTVYPGATEEICVPVLSDESNLIFNKDFFVGYSPERINPGDKVNTLNTIKKITSGSTPETGKIVDFLYNSVIDAGTYLTSSIKIAEAAKVIENSQRDINIAFVNELARIFDIMGLDTNEVLDAACTKWNFLNFRPGLVGGHCIGVDPYYLAQKAEQLGYHPEIILSGRRINDSMGEFIGNKVLNLMLKNKISPVSSKILICGFTFKENCPDFRNTKVIDIFNFFKKINIDCLVYDPEVNVNDVFNEYGLKVLNNIDEIKIKFDSIIVAVAHNQFKKLDFLKIKHEKTIIYDVKGFLDNSVNARL